MKRRWSSDSRFSLARIRCAPRPCGRRALPQTVRGQRPGEGSHHRHPGSEKALTAEQRASLERPFVRESAIRWSNLPVGIVPRTGLRLGDLDAKQEPRGAPVAAAALSACGLKMLDEIRIADDT